MENDASVEIRKSADSHQPLGKAWPGFSTFPTGPAGWISLKKEWLVNGTGDRVPRLRKENPRLGYVGMGNHDPRTKSEAAPDESIVMRAYRSANIRLIIVAVAELGPLFRSSNQERKKADRYG
jgi:hypothetical protein